MDGELYLEQQNLYSLRKIQFCAQNSPWDFPRIVYPAKSEPKVEFDVKDLTKVSWGEGLRRNSFMAFPHCIL